MLRFLAVTFSHYWYSVAFSCNIIYNGSRRALISVVTLAYPFALTLFSLPCRSLIFRFNPRYLLSPAGARTSRGIISWCDKISFSLSRALILINFLTSTFIWINLSKDISTVKDIRHIIFLKIKRDITSKTHFYNYVLYFSYHFKLTVLRHMLHTEIRAHIILLSQSLELLREFKLNFIVLIVLSHA